MPREIHTKGYASTAGLPGKITLLTDKALMGFTIGLLVCLLVSQPACCHQVPLHVLSRSLFSPPVAARRCWRPMERGGWPQVNMSWLVPFCSKALSLCCKSLSRGLSPRVHTCFSAFICKTLTNVFQMRTLLCFPFLYYTLLQFVNTGYRCYLRPHLKKKKGPSRALHIYLKFCIRSHVSSSRRSCKVKQSPLACSVWVNTDHIGVNKQPGSVPDNGPWRWINKLCLSH